MILLNLGGLALAMGWGRVAVTAIGLWILDMLIRTATLVRASNGGSGRVRAESVFGELRLGFQPFDGDRAVGYQRSDRPDRGQAG